MAVNHADGIMFVSVVLYPIAAAIGAGQADAGWLAVLFAPAGLAFGIGVIYLGRKLVYSIIGFGMDYTAKLPDGWRQQVASLPFFLLYFTLPLLIIYLGVFATWFGSNFLARHLI